MLELAIFAAYEVFANIIPGSILLMTGVLLFYPSLFTEMPDSFTILLLIFLSFVFGFVIQGLASVLGKKINKRKYCGVLPSTLFLRDKDKTFPQYFKKAIRDSLNKEFGTPLEASGRHVFDMCYTYVIQNKLSTRVLSFFHMYTFARNMTATVILEVTVCFVWAHWYRQPLVALVGIVTLASFPIFVKRSRMYGESFAKEVLRSFFIDRTSKKEGE